MSAGESGASLHPRVRHLGEEPRPYSQAYLCNFVCFIPARPLGLIHLLETLTQLLGGFVHGCGVGRRYMVLWEHVISHPDISTTNMVQLPQSSAAPAPCTQMYPTFNRSQVGPEILLQTGTLCLPEKPRTRSGSGDTGHHPYPSYYPSHDKPSFPFTKGRQPMLSLQAGASEQSSHGSLAIVTVIAIPFIVSHYSVVSQEATILPLLSLVEREGDMATATHRRPRRCRTLA